MKLQQALSSPSSRNVKLIIKRLWPRKFRKSRSSDILGCLDIPEIVSIGQTKMHGWALGVKKDVVAVLVRVNGTQCLTRCGVRRPDVAHVHEGVRGSLFAGFEFEVDLSGLTDCSVQVVAEIILADGSQRFMTHTMFVARHDSSAQIVSLEHDVAANIEFLKISGQCAYSEALSHIRFEIDREHACQANIRINGDSIAKQSETWTPTSVLFNGVVGIGKLEPGSTHVLSVLLYDLQGRNFETIDKEFTIIKDDWGNEEKAILNLEMNKYPSRHDGIERRRVLVFAPRLDASFKSLYLHNFVRKLNWNSDYEIMVIAGTNRIHENNFQDLNVRVDVIGSTPLKNPFEYEVYLRQIGKHVDEFSPHVIVGNGFDGFPALDVAKRQRIPSVLIVYETERIERWLVSNHGHLNVHPHVQTSAFSAVTRVGHTIFTSNSALAQFAEVEDVSLSSVVPFDIDVGPILEYQRRADQSQLRPLMQIERDEVVFLSVTTGKCHDAILTTAIIFSEAFRNEPRVRLLLVGDPENVDLEILRVRVGILDGGSRIWIFPTVRDVRPWYAVSDVYVDYFEPASTLQVTLEAMASARPVLTASSNELSDVVTDGHTGWMVSNTDFVTMRDGFRTAFSTGDTRRKEMGRAAQERVVRNSKESDVSHVYCSLIDDVIGSEGIS